MVDASTIARYRGRQAMQVITDLRSLGLNIPERAQHVLARQYQTGALTLPDLEGALLHEALRGEAS